MELALVKSELSPRSNRLLVLDADSIQTTKSVKRRRRDSSIAVLGGIEQGNLTEEQQPLSGNVSTAATTVKRSSRFRGVSRHVFLKKIYDNDCFLKKLDPLLLIL